MTFPAPIPFKEALAHLAQKRLMPTRLGSAELAQVSAAIKRRAMFSARTTIEGLLDRYKQGVESILNPQQVLREGATQTVTEGETGTTLRAFIKDYLRQISYAPEPGKEGTIQDLSSDARINLVVKTNAELAQGAGNYIVAHDPDIADGWPAQELYRQEQRETPRNWDGTNPEGDKNLTGFGSRWMQAAQASGDAAAARVMEETGKLIALKSSPIWQALGDFPDGLGNPFPPFAFNSGMWVRDVTRQEAVALGLIAADEEAKAPQLPVAELFKLPEGDE